MYEPRQHPPISRRRFVRRLGGHALVALAVVAVSLAIGMAGYEHFEHLAWRDAFLNTAMLLGGMGPVDAPHTDGGKVFAGVFALWAGLVVLFSVGLIVAPLFHRVLHKFHWSEQS